MTENVALRQQLSASPDEVLARLPALGRIMIVAQVAGVTLERLGVVDKVDRSADQITCVGATHDSVFDMRFISSAAIDRSGRMQGKVLPKLEFLDAEGAVLFGVVGLDGIEKFDAGLLGLHGTPLPPMKKKAPEPATLARDDPSARPLSAANKAEAEITIEMQRPGLRQRWRGRVPEINPAMGFINIITTDFHLHLRGGLVARWDVQDDGGDGDVRLAAIDRDGKPTGLVLQGSRVALGIA